MSTGVSEEHFAVIFIVGITQCFVVRNCSIVLHTRYSSDSQMKKNGVGEGGRIQVQTVFW